LQVPKEVQDALTKAGGTNYRGQPNFRFAWSGGETYLISNGTAYEPFRVCAEDCWLLMKWEPAEFWGTQEEWEVNNWEPSGLFTAGPFPREGRYRMVRSLKKAVIKDGVMTFEHPAPTLKFVDEIFPLLRDFLELSNERKAELIATREKDEKEQLAKKFAASREDYRGIATAKQVEQKTEAIERFLKDPKRIREALALTKRRK
jgi:hypothetical protein